MFADDRSNNTNVEDLLTSHYEPAVMSDEYRRTILHRTREAVAGRRRAVWHRIVFGAAAATVAAIALIFVVCAPRMHERTEPVAVVVASSGEKPIGYRFRSGETVRTRAGSLMTLVMRRGSKLILDANTLASIRRGTLSLSSGRIYCVNRGEIRKIVARAGQVQLLGTTVDAAVKNADSLAVTVVEGKVRLVNKRGSSLVQAGERSVIIAGLPPRPGTTVDTRSETAWYYGKRDMESDFSDIAFAVTRERGLLTEIWTLDRTGARRRVKTYLDNAGRTGPWPSGERKLAVETESLLWFTPDSESRTAHSEAGHPIVGNQTWFLDTLSGLDVPLRLPAGYMPIYSVLSPDARRVALCGSYRSETEGGSSQAGIWLYDVPTGGIKKIADGAIMTSPAWAPDSRRIATSLGEGYGLNHPLVVIDTETGVVTDLHLQGAGACFSPDGTKLAYCGDFRQSGSWIAGVPASGSIFVLDLQRSGEPIRLGFAGQGAVRPMWSPDGTRIAYTVSRSESEAGRLRRQFFSLHVAQADGSHDITVYECDEGQQALAWAESEDGLWVSSPKALLLIASDGSGIRSTIPTNEAHCPLTYSQSKDTQGAVRDIREAIYQFALGNVAAFDGKPEVARASFSACADLLSQVVWKYPLSGLSVDDVNRYADKASEMAKRTDAQILSLMR